MQTLEEFNQKRHDEFTAEDTPHPNGIECPKCKKELWDSDPRATLTSAPPQKSVHCPACGYRGYRLA